jgi:hypothetical protein
LKWFQKVYLGNDIKTNRLQFFCAGEDNLLIDSTPLVCNKDPYHSVMKKLFCVLFFCIGFSVNAQYNNGVVELEDFDFQYLSSSTNMSVVFPEGTLSMYETARIMAFVNNNPVSYADTIELGMAGIPVCGLDGYADYPWWAKTGDEIEFFILSNNIIVELEINPPVLFYPNSVYSMDWGNCTYNFENGIPCEVEFYTEGEAQLFGCTNNQYVEYSYSANQDDGSCLTLKILGCTDDRASNYNLLANFNDSSCEYPTLRGCTSGLADNYNSAANQDDGTCQFILHDLNQSFAAWNVTVDLDKGWNMFGYGCPESIDLVQAMSGHTDNIIILKDNSGKVYMPEFGYNGIGDLSPGLGYQIKVTEALEGFSLCDWYVNDLPEDHIVSLQEENASMKAELDSLYSCTDEGACNFDPTAVLNDGSCDYETCLDECGVVNGDNTTCLDCVGVPNGTAEDLGCGCGNPAAQEGYDCEGNEITSYQVGDLAIGGIVFYIDETGQHGLVAALEDLTEGATDPWWYGFNGYEWGCYGTSISGADGQAIGTGYQNTLDIVNQACTTENGGITAAQAALDAEINGYSDWYLPSRDELIEMYNTIGNGGSEGNIGGFVDDGWPYWSSSEDGYYHAWYVDFYDGHPTSTNKLNTYRVRVIRAF